MLIPLVLLFKKKTVMVLMIHDVHWVMSSRWRMYSSVKIAVS